MHSHTRLNNVLKSFEDSTQNQQYKSDDNNPECVGRHKWDGYKCPDYTENSENQRDKPYIFGWGIKIHFLSSVG